MKSALLFLIEEPEYECYAKYSASYEAILTGVFERMIKRVIE